MTENDPRRTESFPDMPADALVFSLTLQRLLAPIPGPDPCGQDLRYEGTYDLIQEARTEEAGLPQGVWEHELKRADWQLVENLCIEALEQRSKDLQIAAWLLEAAVVRQGFEGCLMGLRLITGLIEAFWDELYPRMEDDDLEGRVGPLVWLNEKAALKLKLVAMTAPRSGDERSYCFADWEQAQHLEKLAVKDKSILDEADARGQATRARFLGSVMFTPADFYAHQCGLLKASLAELGRLNRLLDEHCGPQAPSLNNFRQVLEAILVQVESFYTEKKGDLPLIEADEAGATTVRQAAVVEGDTTTKTTLSIRSRDEAYALLAAAADYLAIHEPHSPTPHLVRRAVGWGRMSLTELLHELIADDSNLRQIFQLLGIKVPPQSHSGG